VAVAARAPERTGRVPDRPVAQRSSRASHVGVTGSVIASRRAGRHPEPGLPGRLLIVSNGAARLRPLGTMMQSLLESPSGRASEISSDASGGLDDDALCDSARRVVVAEARALEGLVPRIGASFAQACRLILACEARVVVTGIGKSEHE